MSNQIRKWLLPMFAVLAVAGTSVIAQSDSERSVIEGRIEGIARASREVVVIAPLEGMIKTTDVKEGDKVTKDQTLLKLDDQLQAIVVASARIQADNTSQLEEAKALLEESKIRLERREIAFKKGVVAEWEIRQAKLEVRRAELAVDQAVDAGKLAASNLKLEEERLRRYNILAPFDGRVIRMQAEEGANIARNEELILIASLDPLEATLYLPDKLYGKVEAGKTYKLVAAEPVNAELTAKLTHVDPLLDAASQTFRCKFEIANPDEKLPANFTVTLPWPQ